MLCCLAVAAMVQGLDVLPADARARAATDVPGTAHLSDIWCRADGSCLAVGSTLGGSGAVVVLHSNGTVGPVRPVPGSQRLVAIACSPAGDCIAVGVGRRAAVVVPVAPDGTPGTVRPVSGASELWGVACPTATTCLATGNLLEQPPSAPYYRTRSVFAVITNGEPAAAQRFPVEPDRLFRGIGCPSATRCLTVGDGMVAVLSDAAGTWTARVTSETPPVSTGVPPGRVTHDISCGSPSGCFATAAAFVQVRSGYRGVPAIIPVSPDGVPGPATMLTTEAGNAFGISCAGGTDTCTVVGNVGSGDAHGFVVVTRGGSPTAITYWTNANFFTAVSCLTADSCGIVGGNNSNGVFAWEGPTLP